MNRRTALVASLVVLTGCHRGSGTSGAAETSASATTASAISAATASDSAAPWGKVPANARRASAPPGIEGRALSDGATAPEFTLPATLGDSFSLDGALSKTKYVVLVFYRGAW